MQAPIAASRRIPSWAWVLLVFALVFACYWPALRGGLVWDDAAHVTREGLRSWAGLGRIWTDLRATQQYYPILHSAFWLEHRFWGDAPLGYHLVNVLLHALSCCLLALVLRRLAAPVAVHPGQPATGGLPAGAPWLAAVLFAVHPVCVESVAWISEQKNTLSLAFYLLAAIAYLDFDDTRRPGAYARALALFLLALATKSVTATLPAALLVLLWWRRGRLGWRRDVAPLAPWFVVAAAAGLLTAWIERTLIGAEGGGFELSAGQRLLLAGRVPWFYLGKLAWPFHLMFVYPRWDVAAQAAGWIPWLGGTLAVTAALWRLRNWSRGPLAAWLFFLGTLFPALGFFNVYPFRFSYVADHFQYQACLGIVILAASGLALWLLRESPVVRAAGRIVLAFLVVGLAGAANRQSRTFRGGEALYRATLAENPACWMAHNNLAVELARHPATAAEAREHYEEALRLKPDYAEAHNNFANLLVLLPGRRADAIGHLEEALRLDPGLVEARVNLAHVLAEEPGRAADAAALAAQALQLEPNSPEAHCALANALARIPGRLPEALGHYAGALRLNPRFAEAHVDLANALAGVPGRMPEALAHYAEALRLEPGLARAHYDLACQLSTIPGRAPEAIAHYEQALQLRPDYPQAHNNLAIAYAQQGRLDEARQHWERALELDPRYDDARRNLLLLQQLGKK